MEKLEKVGKSAEKGGKVTKSGEKLEKVGKSSEKWGKVGKVGKRAFLKFWTKWPPPAILDVRK